MIPDQEPPAANPTPIQPGGSGAELTWPVSARIAGRFESRAGRRRSAAIAYIATAAAYLGWRTTIIAPDSAALSWAYLVAEFLGFVLGLSTLLDSWDYRHREPPPALPDRTVDVFVPVYREPLAIIRRTLRAAAGIRYPHQTWVLDDGNRDDVRILAQSLGLRYLARPENRNAKAGNLNFGLAHSEAEFVAVFDADHVAMPHALEVMLGFFEDASVAMVQTPQDYFNTDAFQYINPRGKPGLWHDQSFFYNVVQSCRDGRNAVSCVGTGVVYRRSALRAIGGIPEETLTEDLHTSLKLHKAGWRAVHLNEPVAYGIAAADVADYYRTRYRWAHGNLAALRIERVLTCRGLDMRQRLSYLATGLIYLEGWQQLLLFAVPPCALVFGLRPFDISIFNVLVVLSFPLLAVLLLQEAGCGFRRYWTEELFSMARWPVHLRAAPALFGGRARWRSSRKNIGGRVDLGLLAPQIAIFAINAAALAYAAHRLSLDFNVGPLGGFVMGALDRAPRADVDIFATFSPGYSVDLVAIAGFWALYNAVRAASLVVKALSSAIHAREFYRFDLSLPAIFPAPGGVLARTERLAEDWVRLRIDPALAGAAVTAELDLHIMLPAGVVKTRLQVLRSGRDWIEGSLAWPDARSRDRLSDCLHSVSWQRELQGQNVYFLTPTDAMVEAVRAARRGRGSREQGRGEWRPVLLEGAGLRGQVAMLLSAPSGENETSLLCFCPLEAGMACVAGQAGELAGTRIGLEVLRAEAIAALSGACLDGVTYRKYRVRIAPVSNRDSLSN